MPTWAIPSTTAVGLPSLYESLESVAVLVKIIKPSRNHSSRDKINQETWNVEQVLTGICCDHEVA